MLDDFRSKHKKPQIPSTHTVVDLPKTVFTTPDVAAHHDQNTPMPFQGNSATISTHSKKRWWHKFKHLTKKQWVIIVAIAVLLLGGGVGAYFVWFKHDAKPVVHKTVVKPKKIVPKPVPLTSTLTGLPIADAAINQKQVTAVMVENSTAARPQSGLDQAGVVFEAVAEGGITRFTALYQDTSTDYIGPVRSVRPYYLSWLMGFDAAVAHVGGSGEALEDISAWNVKNLDQGANGNSFTRITSRYAPHNVYTSIANLNALESKFGYNTSTYTGFARKAAAPSAAPTATGIDLAISGFDYNVHYDYDAAANAYKRSEGGEIHTVMDAAGVKTQLAPKVVIAIVMPQNLEADGLHNEYGTVGSGQTFVFQDGIMQSGTWKKDSNTTQLTFTDAAGKVIALNPGQTWITALSSADKVTYK